MPWGLKRFHQTDGLHFITWSCCDRRPLLAMPERRDLFLKVLERMRSRYRFAVVGFVVMPEHVHLLLSEPLTGSVSSAICAVKLGFARRVLREKSPPLAKPARSGAPRTDEHDGPEVGHAGPNEHSTGQHLWMKRYYDFNVFSSAKIDEKLHYMHQNPVARGLVERPEDWKWSSFRAYACGEDVVVRVNDWSWWEKKIRERVS